MSHVTETGNYLRARGEYGSHRAARLASAELPPRTRRIRDRKMPPPGQKGTTSAHAENTKQLKPGVGKWRNYLRARGEYFAGSPPGSITRELPPRTRRIHVNVDDFENNLGTTSAHAENTFETFTSVAQNRNYLRARGEYDEKQEIIDLERELPPRTRRIRVSPLSPNQDRGTTSAHAENTTTALLQSCGRWNYLRARGEYRLGFVKSFASSGTTSAHAENTDGYR